MGNRPNIQQLFDRFITNTCTPDEAMLFVRLLESGQQKEEIEQLLDAHLQVASDIQVDDATLEHVFRNVASRAFTKRRPRKYLRLSIVSAAAMLLAAVMVTSYQYASKDQPAELVLNDIAPGGNRATLTLTDGRTVDLNAEQGGIVVGDEIRYTDGSSVSDTYHLSSQPASLLSLTTPKGGTYRVTLPDGTNVWLNSASTLRYPSRFNERERLVELEGEAYFEVSRSDKRGKAVSSVPFKVVSPGQTVEVLGTHFNINAYSDEHTTNTTLLEGAVRVTADNHTALLKPGQQSKVGTEGLRVTEVDTETVVDWKNGDFVFVDETLDNIMREIARWYDVDIVYQGRLRTDRYNGQISRNKNLSEVLHILELSGGLTYNISDRTLCLSPPQDIKKHTEY